MKKLLHVFLSFLTITLAFHQGSKAQTVYMEMYMDNWFDYSGDCGDCISSPDPRMYARVKNSSSGSYSGEWKLERDNYGGGCTGNESFTANANNFTRSGVPYTDNYQVEIKGYESDGGVCGGDDGNCGGYANVWNSAISSVAPCGYNTFTPTRSCNSDGVTNSYTLRDAHFRYYFESASLTNANAGGSITYSGATSVCNGYDPPAFTDASSPLRTDGGVNWQVSVNGGAYSDISGATNVSSYDPGVLTTGTYAYRRRTRYCTNFSGGTTDVYSTNTYTITVYADPVAPTATKSPNVTTVCAGASLTLTGVTDNGGGTGTCNIEYSHNGGAWTTTLTPITATVGTNTIAIRKNCNGAACDISAVNTYSWTVVADPTAPTATKSPAVTTVCAGATLSLTGSTAGTGGTGTCNFEYRYSTDGVGYTSWSTSIPSFTAVTGTNYIEIRTNCNGNGCDPSPATSYSWTVVADPSAPTNTPTPSASTVCVGATLSASAGSSSGGTGTCSYEYAIDPGTGTFGSWGATNSVTASGVGTYIIKSRRNCNGTGCDISPETTTTWTVVADPTVPTLTPTPAVSTVCVGASLSATASGSTGGTGTCNYEYAIDPGTGTFGSWGATNSVTASSAGTYKIKARMNCNGTSCDISPETTTTWTVVIDPVAPTATKSPATTTVCAGATLTLTSPTSGGGGTGTCNFEYRYSTDGVGYSSWSTSVPSFSAVVGTNYIEIRTNCNGNSCDNSPATVYSWTVVADPTAPTNTPTPSASTVCVGASLSISAGSSSGGTGTCSYEYAIDPGTGTFGSWGATNSVTASGTGTYRMKSRMNCNGNGCDISPESAITTWTVVADPTAPTATKSPTDASVCAGQTLTLTSPTLGMGGTGTCNFEYRYNTGGGFSSWGSSIPSFTAVTGTNTIEIRTNCTGNSCDASSASSYSWTVAADPSAPTGMTKSPSDASVCIGATLTVTGATSGSGGTGTCNVEYRYSTDNGGSYSGWSTSVPSISAVIGTTIIQASTICTGLACDRSATSQVSWVVIADPSAPTATKSPNTTFACDGEVITLTNITDNGGGTGTCNTEFALDPGTGTYGTWTTTVPSYTVVAPSGDVRIKMRKNCNGVACDISNETVYSWDIYTKSTDPTSLTPTATFVCAGSTVYLLVNGGSLGNDGSQWYLYDADPNAGGNLLASNTSGFFTISNISGTYDYYVRAEGDCGVTALVNAQVVTSAGTDASTYDDCIVSSTTTGTCNVSGTQTHYFVNSSNCEIFQINSNGANLGSTTLTTTIAGNGPVGDGGDFANCDVANGGPGGEYHVERVFNFSSVSSPSGANITLTQCISDAEYNNYAGLSAFTDPDYQRCYGTTSSAADLSVTCFNSAGNVAFVGAPTYSSKTLGGNTVHCYTFTIASSNLRTRGTNATNITTYGDCGCYLHSSGGEGGPLPIELTAFTGTYTNNAVRLDWTTASEKNNDFFELLRSTDGTNFEVIATLDSKAPYGNSNYIINYEYNDNEPVGGIIYYQLKQTDYDGTTSLSKIVSVEVPEQLIISEFRPNPAKNDVTVKVSTVRNSDIQFALVSIDGRVVIEKNYNFTKGVNTINLSLNGISSGTYIGEFIIDGKKYHKKLIITE
jgi:hypothetical protein